MIRFGLTVVAFTALGTGVALGSATGFCIGLGAIVLLAWASVA